MNKYTISFCNSSNEDSNSISYAKKLIKWHFGFSRLCCVEYPDGIYCYKNKKEEKTDATGAKAWATIRKTGGETFF